MTHGRLRRLLRGPTPGEHITLDLAPFRITIKDLYPVASLALARHVSVLLYVYDFYTYNTPQHQSLHYLQLPRPGASSTIVSLASQPSPKKPQLNLPKTSRPSPNNCPPEFKMAQAKDRITCHILDTSLGRPARGVRVRLSLEATASTASAAPHHGQAPVPGGGAPRVFESQTDDDGRIKTWLPYSSATSSGEVPVYTLEDVLGDVRGPSRWTLRFDTAGYYGEENTFFPEVTVVFRVEEGQTYHVPLLLAPYSYSTYRGS